MKIVFKSLTASRILGIVVGALAYAAVLVVISVPGRAATFDVSNTGDSGAGTLRSAIGLANSTPGADTITFSVASGTIALTSPLPPITEQVSIINAGAPDIELNGAAAGGSAVGIWIRTANCVVSGLVINRFQEAGIRIDTGGGNSLLNNFIGTDVAGAAALPNINRGVLIVGTSGNLIGDGTVAGRNLISGNLGRGIEVTAGGSVRVRGNRIGTNAAGTGDLGNSEQGVWIVWSSGSIIGGTAGTTPLGACTGDCNLISGNTGSGVQIVADINLPASGNSVLGNFIGTNVAGTGNLGNDGSGVSIQASGNFVGDGTPEGRNVISGNSANGVSISSTLATLNTVSGNYIGVTTSGTGSLPNDLNGVQISSQASNNLIGGTSAVYSNVGAPGNCNNSCNIISNNGVPTAITARAGIYVDATGGTGNSFRRNTIGFNPITQPPNDVGIDLQQTGETPNDLGDPDAGANRQQNFPVIDRVYTSGLVFGTINSTSSRTFTLDFYLNTVSDGTRRMGRIYLGSVAVTTNASGNASFVFTSPQAPIADQPITATATDNVTGDTSEFALPVGAIPAPPTAAGVTVSGRTLDSAGRSAGNVTVVLTSNDGTARSVVTNRQGYFSFDDVETGTTYVLSAGNGRFRYPSRVVEVNDNVSDLVLIADP